MRDFSHSTCSKLPVACAHCSTVMEKAGTKPGWRHAASAAKMTGETEKEP